MGAEIWLVNIFSAIFITVGAWLLIKYIFPLLEDMLSETIKEKKSLISFMSLLNIVLLWVVAQGIVNYLLKINNQYLNYLDTLSAGLDVMLEFMPYLKWVILGWFILLAIKRR